MYGVDVSAKRADDLDKKLLATVSENRGSRVLELGCGSGAQSQRLVAAGAAVTAVDIQGYSDWENEKKLHFVEADMREFLEQCSSTFGYCSFQRTIHYLPYDDALAVLKKLRKLVTKRLYISVSGLESDIGDCYAAKNSSIKERFAKINQTGAETFSISEPLCLYTPEEFMVLLQDSGWTIEELWVSAFGNIKAICC